MKEINLFLTLCIALFSCNTEVPTQFSAEAMNDTFIALDNTTIQFRNIIKQYEDKTIVIDVWASWCSDCIKGIPKVKALQKQFPDAIYLFLSADRSIDAWKKGIVKYNVKGEHYYMGKDWKTPFGKFVDLDWIPRYMIIDAKGNIKLFKAIKADDKRLREILKK